MAFRFTDPRMREAVAFATGRSNMGSQEKIDADEDLRVIIDRGSRRNLGRVDNGAFRRALDKAM
jgi:hypothetical protein